MIMYNNTNDQDKANILNQYFSSVFTVEQISVDTDIEVSEMQPITVNPDGVASVLF